MITGRAARSRTAREIASALVRLTRRASHLVDAVTIGELHQDVTEVDRVLQRLADVLATEVHRHAADSSAETDLVSMAVEVFDLEEEWRQSRQRESTHRREHLTNSLMRLRSVRTDQELFDQLCPEACRACGTDRALLAGVSAGSWTPWRQFNAHPTRGKTRPLPAGTPEALAGLAIESAVIEDRRTVQVPADTGIEIPAPVRQLMRRRPFSVAPITLSDNTISDSTSSDSNSHDVVALIYVAEPTPDQWSHNSIAPYLDAFAASAGHVLQRAALFAHLERQFSYLRDSLSAAEHALTAFDTDVDLVRLVGREQAGPTPVGEAPWTMPRSAPDQGLTARERDVMSLLARGLDNAEIGQELAIATTTVKSHVQNMLRKAGAVNRAELIAQYYRRGLRPV